MTRSELLVAGADGCRGGWVVAYEHPDSDGRFARIKPDLARLFDDEDRPEMLAIDIPIGLTDSGPRECDEVARRILGPGRGSSVFPAPIRPLLGAADYSEANRIRREVEGKGLSKQAWAIVPKVREVDTMLRTDAHIRARVREVHPEVCFHVLAGDRPMRFGKKKAEGRRERIALLDPLFDGRVSVEIRRQSRAECSADDVIDAFVALWTARRLRDGVATRLPPGECPRDRFGLPMEMVA